MPIMDGYVATNLLRQGGYRQPIVGLTANTVNNGLRLCVSAGCDEALGKPFNREAFNEILSKYLKARNSVNSSASEESASEFDSEQNEIRRGFLSRLPARLKKIDVWLQQGDWDQIKAEAHKLAGSGLLGFPDISTEAKKLEELIKMVNMAQIQEQVRKLVAICEKYQETIGIVPPR